MDQARHQDRFVHRSKGGSEAVQGRPKREVAITIPYRAEDFAHGGFSALVLAPAAAPGRDDDGYLRLRDVVERWRDRLPATHLVMLGVCDSKGGRRVQEDDLVAMPAAFHFAGVPAAVAAL